MTSPPAPKNPAALSSSTPPSPASPTTLPAASTSKAAPPARPSPASSPFNSLHEHARAGLTEWNNTVFVTYASHTDAEPYHGEILGFNASTLKLVNQFIANPNGNECGIWNGGAAPAIDTTTGNMFVMTGNGDWDQKSGAPYTTATDFGESILKLPTNATGPYSVSFSDPTSWFTPSNYQNLTNNDLDVGSSGVCLLPDQSGAHTHIMVGGGKGGVLYVVDRDNLSGENATDGDIQEITEANSRMLFVTPAYFNGYIYYSAAGGPLEQRAVGYNATTGKYIADPATYSSTETYATKGSGCFITANGTSNGLIWMTNGSLRVHNAANVTGNPIYTFTVPGSTAKFSVPTVANGKAYVCGFSESSRAANNACTLYVLGLLNTQSTVPAPAPTALTAAATSSTSIQLGWSNTATNLSGFYVWRATAAAGPFTNVTPSGISAGVTTYTDTGLAPGTTYYYYVTSYNNVGNSSPTATVNAKTLTTYAPPGLVAYWPLDENTGATTADASGNGHTGTLVGEYNWTTGLINSAVNFHGTNNAAHVAVADSPALEFGAAQSFTIGAWVFPVTTSSGKEQTLLNKSADQGNEYGLYINADGNWAFRTGSSANPNDVAGPAATANTWTYVCGVQDVAAGTRTLYINGAAVATGPVEPGDGHGQLFIGSQNLAAPNDNSFQGEIDEVRVYNTAIPASQATSLMSAPIYQGVSNQVHGTAGTFGLLLTPSATIVTEPRQGSTAGSYSIQLTFSCPVTGIAAALQTQGGGAGSGSVGAITYNAAQNIVTVPLTNVADAQALNLHLTGILPSGAPAGTPAATADIPFDVLWGDINRNNAVDYIDATLMAHTSTQATTSANYLYDINCDGIVGTADTAIVNAEIGTTVGTQLPTLLSLYQPTSDSTSNTGNVSSYAVDGNTTTTRWESHQGVDPQWFEVDLGSACSIQSITIYWETAKAADFYLQTSVDNQNWTNLLPEVTGNTSANSTTQTFTGLTGSGRYVRMYALERATIWGDSIWEFQVNGINTIHTANPAPSITGDTTFSGTQGTAISGITITASNTPTHFVASNLPPGLAINATTGAITGTPTSAGIYTSYVTASNGSGSSASTPLGFNIAGTTSAPVITSASTASGTVNTPFVYTTTATNNPASFKETGTLPAGLAFSTTSGVITGTPTATGTSTISITATNSGGTSPALSLTISVSNTVTSAPAISATPAPPIGNTGTAYSYQVSASNSPNSYAYSGNLPAGLGLNTSTGLISGTPTSTGTSTFSITASNNVGTSAPVGFSITINPPVPVVSATPAPPAGSVGTAYSYSIVATNGPTSYAYTGTIPPGLNFDTGAGTITGTPTTSGTYNFSVTATNSGGTSQAVALSITISANPNTPVVNTTPAPPTGVLGTAYSYQVNASNSPSAYAYTGSLPAGLGLNTTTGLISGTPTAAGTSTFSITASNSSGTSTSASFSIPVVSTTNPVPAIISVPSVSGTVGTALTYYISANNSATSYAESGTLPGGLNFSATSQTISGTPRTAGTSTVTLTATNSVGTSSATPLVITIYPSGAAPTITSGSNAATSVGTPFRYQITASDAPSSYAMTGTLTPGLGFSTTTGAITGTLTATGTTTVNLTAKNTAGTSAPIALTIAGNPVSTDVNVALNQTTTGSTDQPPNVYASAVDGNTTTRWSASSGSFPQYWEVNLGSVKTLSRVDLNGYTAASRSYQYSILTSPDGLNWTTQINQSGNTTVGLTSDTFLAPVSAQYVIVNVTGASGGGWAALNEVSVYAQTTPTAPVVSTTPAPAGGTVGIAYSYQVRASGSPVSYAYSGSLPAGLNLNTTTGLISGTPTTPGTSNFSITATNNVGPSQPASFSITISPTPTNPPSSIISVPAMSGTVGTAFSYVVSANNAPSSYALSGTLPAGLTFNASTHTISGTPTTAGVGTHTVSLTATNAFGTGPAQPLTITIYASAVAPTVTSVATAAATVGSPFSYQITASDAPSSYALTGTLPSGLSFSTTTGAITGTLTATGTVTVNLTASNTHGAGAPLALTIAGNPASGDTNVALNQAATGSTDQPPNVYGSAVDGNTTTRWSASDGSFPQYWQVNLGSVRTLSRVDLNGYTAASRYYQYSILTSTDGINWTTQINKSANTTAGLTSDAFTAPVTAQYVIISVTGATPYAWAAFNEISVYGH